MPLRDTYDTCCFLGAILAGEYTAGGKNQLASHGITVFHVPFRTLADCFFRQGVDLDYPEDASDEHKRSIIARWESLSEGQFAAVKQSLWAAIADDYSEFRTTLVKSLVRQVKSVVILPLYGSKLQFRSVPNAIAGLSRLDTKQPTHGSFVKFEVQLRFSDGDRIEGSFHAKHQALDFLRRFA